MARSMGGGGGRSGGGSHSSGRSMGSSHRSGSRSHSSSGGHRAGSFSSSSGGHRRPSSSGYRPSSPPPHHHHGGPGMPPPPHHHHHHHHDHYGYHRHYDHGPRYYGRPARSSGCASAFATIFIFMIIFIIVMANLGGGSGGNKKLNRDKYTGSVDSSQGYYIDDSIGDEKFIDRSNESTLISGFKAFYNRTGVYPFLYIAEHKPSKSDYEGYDTYEDMLYDTLFNSEGNLLFVYIADEDSYYVAAGYNTSEIVDDESLDIMYRKIDNRWSSGDLAVAFGKGLDDASKNIMAKSNTRVIMIVIVVGVIAVVVVNMLIRWSKKKKELELQEAEKLEQILDTPLETFGSSMDELGQKYENMDNNNQNGQ